MIRRAGEVLCHCLSLDEDPILHFREGDAPTIAEYLDPVQVFIPAPTIDGYHESKVIEHLAQDKPKVVTIMAEVLEASANTMRQYEDVLVEIKLR